MTKRRGCFEVENLFLVRAIGPKYAGRYGSGVQSTTGYKAALEGFKR